MPPAATGQPGRQAGRQAGQRERWRGAGERGARPARVQKLAWPGLAWPGLRSPQALLLLGWGHGRQALLRIGVQRCDCMFCFCNSIQSQRGAVWCGAVRCGAARHGTGLGACVHLFLRVAARSLIVLCVRAPSRAFAASSLSGACLPAWPCARLPPRRCPPNMGPPTAVQTPTPRNYNGMYSVVNRSIL